eukprot:jgi/Hompol1/88/HPOL_005197-RA
MDVSATVSSSPTSIVAFLRHRAQTPQPHKDSILFTLDTRGKDPLPPQTHEKLYHRVLGIASHLRQRLQSGTLRPTSRVALLYRTADFTEYFASLLACFLVSLVAVPIVTTSLDVSTELSELEFVLENCGIEMCLTTDANIRVLTKLYASVGKQRGTLIVSGAGATGTGVGIAVGGAGIPKLEWIKTNEIGSFTVSKRSARSANGVSEDPAWVKEALTVDATETVAYIEFVKNARGEYKGVEVHHGMVLAQCQKHVGLLFAGFLGVFSGCRTCVFPEAIVTTPKLWSASIGKYKVTTFVTDPASAHILIAANSKPSLSASLHNELSSLARFVINADAMPISMPELLSNVFLPNGIAGPHVVGSLTTLNEFGGLIISMDVGFSQSSSTMSSHAVRVTEIHNRKFEPVLNHDPADPRIIKIRDSGFIVQQDDETDALVAQSGIGEIWVSSQHIPRRFCMLPKLTETALRAHPIVFTSTSDTSISGFNLVQIDQTNTNEGPSNQKSLVASYIGLNYIRTGLYGFFIKVMGSQNAQKSASANPTQQQIAVAAAMSQPKLFILGSAADIILQRKAVLPASLAPAQAKGYDSWVKPSEMPPTAIQNDPRADINFHFSGHLVQTIVQQIGDVSCIACFDIQLRGEFLPVVLIETTREDYDQVVMQTRDWTIASGFQTEFASFDTRRIIQVTHNSVGEISKQTLHRLAPLDIDACRTLFLQGSLYMLHLYLGGDPIIFGGLIEGNGPISSMLDDPSNTTKTATPTPAASQIVGSMKDVPIYDDKHPTDLRTFTSLVDLLTWRVETTPDAPAFTQLDLRAREIKTVPFAKLSMKIHALAIYLLTKRRIIAGDHVLLICSHGIEFHIAVWACLYAGIICIPIHPPDANRLKEDIPLLVKLVEMFSVREILVTTAVEEDFRSRSVRDAIASACAKAALQNLASSNSKIDLKDAATSSAFPPLCNISKVPKTGKKMSREDVTYQPRR